METLGRPLTYTEAKDIHEALFVEDAVRLREMNACIGKYESEDSDECCMSDDPVHINKGTANPQNLDIGEVGQLVVDLRCVEDIPAALGEKNISIGTWDDVSNELLKWESGTNAAEKFLGIVNTADADADGQTDYHYFVIHACRRSSNTPAPAPALPVAEGCACVDTECSCAGACENNCEPSVELGVSKWAKWCATTHCVSCRKHFVELHGG